MYIFEAVAGGGALYRHTWHAKVALMTELRQPASPPHYPGLQEGHCQAAGSGSASARPAQRQWCHLPHASQLSMRSPSSSRVPQLQATTQSSWPPFGLEEGGLVGQGSCADPEDGRGLVQ